MSDVSKALDAIAARAEAATEGPWVAHDLGDATYTSADSAGWWWVWRKDALPYYGGVLEPSGDFPVRGEDGRLYKVYGAVGTANITDSERGLVEKTDAEFIAHARQDVPALVAALRAVLDECRVAQGFRGSLRAYMADDIESLITAALTEVTS